MTASLCALALTGALAACSSSKKSGTSPTTGSSPTTGAAGTSSSSASQPTGTPINVGMMCTCSQAGGFGAYDVPGRDMYQAWVNTVNAGGRIAGHPVHLIAEDDAGNPGTAAGEVQTLISDHVVAIVDISVIDQTFAATVQKAGIPVVGAEANNEAFGTNPDFYPEAQTNDSAIQAVIMTAKAAGATNLGNIYCAESPVCAQSVPAFKTTGQRLGVPVSYNAEISATAPNYTAQCLAAQQQHITALFIGDASAVITRLASDCDRQGYDPIYITEGAGFAMTEASGTGLKNKLWNEFPGLPLFATTPAAQAANTAMDKYFPGVRKNATLWDQIDFMSWSSGMLLEDALKAGGLTSGTTPTASLVTKGLNSLSNDTLGGLAPPLTFTAGKPHAVDCWFTSRMQNGVPHLVNNGQVTCANGTSS